MRSLGPAEAVTRLADWLALAAFVDLANGVSQRALHAAQGYQMAEHQMHIYDAQMWDAAKVHAISVLLTEDVQFQPEIEGVRYLNPFASSFQPADIGL